MSDTGPSTIIERRSGLAFAPTLERVTAAIEAAGLAIVARIDHAAAAREAGLTLPPTTVLIYGHAKNGTPIMQATPKAALDLPLRVLVREDASGAVFIAFHPIASMLVQAGVADTLAARLEPAQRLLIGAIQP